MMTKQEIIASQTFEDLRKEVHRRGWNNPPSARILFEFFVHCSIAFLGGWVYFVSSSISLKCLGMFINIVGSIGIASNSHSATHSATFKSRWANKLFSFIGGPILFGMSAHYWHNKHVILHHRAPNVLGIDGDIDLTPVFAMTTTQKNHATGARKLWFQLQWIFAPLLLCLTAIGMNKNGWVYLWNKICSSDKSVSIYWIDLACLFLNFLIWCSLPLLFNLSFVAVGIFYCLRMLVMGYAFFVILAPSHLPAEALSIKNDLSNLKQNTALVLHSTLNFKCSSISKFFLSGLQYQIEHHLFPKISHVYYPDLSPLLKQYCHQHRLPYRTVSWRSGIWKSLLTFREPKRIHEKI